jgi:ABC-type transport system involved in multi-copper enzyme maturation permease subunit
MRGITRDTVIEMTDRKGTLIMIGGMLVGLVAVLTSDLRQLRISFGDPTIGGTGNPAEVAEIALHFLSTYMGLLIGVVVILAAGLFPGMLHPDRTWFMFSRPLSRGKIVIEKLTAVVLVYSSLLVFTVVPAVVVGIIRYDLLDIRIGEIALIHIFNVTIWLVIVSSFGLLWRSTSKVMLAGLVLLVMQWLLANRAAILESLDIPLMAPLLNAWHSAMPKTIELGRAAHEIAAGREPGLFMPIITTLLFTFVLLYLGLSAVRRRDL